MTAAKDTNWKKMGKRAKFFCTVRSCEQVAVQFINSVAPLKEQVNNNTKRIEELERRLAAQETSIRKDTEEEVYWAINKVNKAMEDETVRMKEEVKTVIKEENQRNSQEETVAVMTVEKEKMKAEVKTVMDTERDRIFRARNLILANVPEPDTDNMDTGKASDLEFVTNLFTEHMKLNKENCKIIDASRLYRGQNSERAGQQQDYQEKPRLLRVRFEAEEMVGVVGRAAPHLESTGNLIAKGVRIFRDKTRSEREERKSLINTAVKKNEEETNSEEFKWIVDYQKKDVIRVPKENSRRMTFRQRKYR